MALEKVIVVDKIEVLEMGQIQVRTATRVMEDGVQLSSSFHRHVLAPGDSIENEDPRVQSIASATWTPGCINAYEAMIEAQQADMP